MLLCSSRSNTFLIDHGLELRLRCSMSCSPARQDCTVLAGVQAGPFGWPAASLDSGCGRRCSAECEQLLSRSHRWSGGFRDRQNGWRWRTRSWEGGVDLAGDVALETADDLAFAETFDGSSLHVVPGRLMVAHADDGDDVKGAVSGSVAATAEPVPAAGASAAGRLWGDTAKFGKGCLVTDPVGVIAGGGQELAGDLDADPVQLDQCWGGDPDEALDLVVEGLDLGVERLPASGQVSQSCLDPGQQQPIGIARQREKVFGVGTQPQAAVDQGPFGQHDQLITQRGWGADHDPPERVERLGAGLHRTGPGHP